MAQVRVWKLASGGLTVLVCLMSVSLYSAILDAGTERLVAAPPEITLELAQEIDAEPSYAGTTPSAELLNWDPFYKPDGEPPPPPSTLNVQLRGIIKSDGVHQAGLVIGPNPEIQVVTRGELLPGSESYRLAEVGDEFVVLRADGLADVRISLVPTAPLTRRWIRV